MPNRKIRASLHVIPTELGGRDKPIFDNWRPVFFAIGASVGTGFLLQKIEGGEKLNPGESGVVHGVLFFPEGVGVPVGDGTAFDLRDGNRVVATGIIEEYA